jgi:hypothetical protein
VQRPTIACAAKHGSKYPESIPQSNALDVRLLPSDSLPLSKAMSRNYGGGRKDECVANQPL